LSGDNGGGKPSGTQAAAQEVWSAPAVPDADGHMRLDLRGIKCPLNWAYAKVRLETMRRGEMIELLIDDPRGVRDIPRAAEAEGHSIIDLTAHGSEWRLRIEK
jgi:tRNA 2-thiouridine synthesizing protein A